jgi:hypothetical protein
VVALPPGGHVDRATGRCVLDRVVDQVHEHVAQSSWVAKDCWYASRNVYRQLHTARRRQAFEHRLDLADHLGKLYRNEVKIDLARLGAGEFEDVVHEVDQLDCRCLDGFGGRTRRRRLLLVVRNHVGLGDDDGEGGAELVAEPGEEVRSVAQQAADLFGALLHPTLERLV